MSEQPEVIRPARILVVDDEEPIRLALKSILGGRGHTVDVAESGEEGVRLANECPPDIIVLDLTLPGMSGLDACRELRAWYHGPILILSVRDGDDDKIAALDLGADDYLTKPFSTGELLARIRALLRRVRGIDVTLSETSAGELHIDFATRQVEVAGERVKLTPTEFDILAVLARNSGRVVTAATLIEGVWGPETAIDTRALRVHVSNLRRKIEPPNEPPLYVLTEPGVGFRFAGTE